MLLIIVDNYDPLVQGIHKFKYVSSESAKTF